jgi:hypothetical protein
VIVIASQSTDWMTITGMIRRYTSLEGDVIFDHMYNAEDGTRPLLVFRRHGAALLCGVARRLFGLTTLWDPLLTCAGTVDHRANGCERHRSHRGRADLVEQQYRSAGQRPSHASMVRAELFDDAVVETVCRVGSRMSHDGLSACSSVLKRYVT